MRLKDLFIYGLSAAAIGLSPVAAAQSVSESQVDSRNPITKMVESSNGRLEVDIPGNILDLLVNGQPTPQRPAEKRRGPVLQKGINKIRGYRVQVFADGRNQSTLEARVKARANSISARFPKYRGQVYTFSSSPNWYCRVGNFQTEKEAHAALLELKRAFPSFAGEMRVVNSEVIIISR